MSAYYSIAKMVLNQSSIFGHLGCFQFITIIYCEMSFSYFFFKINAQKSNYQSRGSVKKTTTKKQRKNRYESGVTCSQDNKLKTEL